MRSPSFDAGHRGVVTLRPGVHLLQGEVGGRPLQLPLLVGQAGALLIDSGCAWHARSLIWPALHRLGVSPDRLRWIVNTHCDLDHVGGNAEMKNRARNAVLACGEADRAQIEAPPVMLRRRYDAYREAHGHVYSRSVLRWIRTALGAAQTVDVTFRGGELLRLAPDWLVEIVALPGHSDGHLGLWDHRHHILFGGDAIQGDVYLGLDGRPALCPTYLHVRPYLATIEFIRRLPLKTYVSCHWPVKQGPAAIKEFCSKSEAFVRRTERLVREAIRRSRGRMTLAELCRELGPRLGDWPRAVDHELCYALAGHLADLTARGLVRENRRSVPFRYSVV